MNKFINTLLYLIFGEWNGVQNFMAPTVMFLFFNQYSFINWITGMLTLQRYFLPLFFYTVILFSVIFLCIKILIQWDRYSDTKTKPRVKVFKDLLLPLFIKIHVWILIFLTAIIIIYLLKNGFAFIYRRSFPIFIVYYWFIRISGIAITLYIFNLLEIAIPVIKNGRSFDWAQKYFHKIVLKHWKTVIPIFLVQLIWIFVSVLLFSIIVDHIQIFNNMGLIHSGGKPIEVIFKEVHNTGQFFYNTGWLLLAFLISNLMFFPLVYFNNWTFNKFHFSIKKI